MESTRVFFCGSLVLADFCLESVNLALLFFVVSSHHPTNPRGNVELIVNRWPEHIDAIIKMPQQLNGQVPLAGSDISIHSIHW